jgi:hypothetical protein
LIDNEVVAKVFFTAFYDTLVVLANEIMNPLFLEAVLVGKLFSAPGQAALIVFTMIVPVQSRTHNPKLQFSSLEFFRCQKSTKVPRARNFRSKDPSQKGASFFRCRFPLLLAL